MFEEEKFTIKRGILVLLFAHAEMLVVSCMHVFDHNKVI